MLVMRSFGSMSVREMKRQARRGNLWAARAYSVRGAFGAELWAFLWILVGIASSIIVLLLNSLLWTWLAVVVSSLLLLLSVSLLPRLKRPPNTLRLASQVSPLLASVLGFTRPVLSPLVRVMRRFVEDDPFYLVRSRDELLELIRHADESAGLSSSDVRLAEGALTYADKTIGSIMIPLGAVKKVNADAVLSPVELSELHDSGFSRFPVVGEEGRIIGTLFLKDAVELRSNKSVRDVMRADVYYVNESETLEHALKAFLKTKHHLFVVVNEFEDMVGIVTIEDVIEQILGQRIVDEFDQYDDVRAVAQVRADKERKARMAGEQAKIATSEETVVE